MESIIRGLAVRVACLALWLAPFGAAAAPADNVSFREIIAAGAQVVDVRTPEEFAAGHIEGAKNIEYDEVLNHLSEFHADRSKPVVLYCGSGFRAGRALRALQAVGYSAVYNAGGYDELKEKLSQEKK